MTGRIKPKVKFVLSVDTEEEWDWSGPFPQDNFAVENIKRIPKFQSFCQSLGIKPSYFVDYAVVNDPESVAILGQPLHENKCEIAAHLHPWCNPPYFGQTNEFESHVVNLPLEQVEQKLAELTQKLKQEFGIQPNAFRTGRWGINGDVLKLLVKYGYQIDSSVYPFYNHQYFDCRKADTVPYWPDYVNESLKGSQRDILQVPVSVGFNHNNFSFCNRVHDVLSCSLLQFIRPIGVAWHLGLLKKLYMSPELSSADDMCQLVDSILARGDGIVHMYLHSSSFMSGATGFIEGAEPLRDMCDSIKKVVQHLQLHADVEFCSISDAAIPHLSASTAQPEKACD